MTILYPRATNNPATPCHRPPQLRGKKPRSFRSFPNYLGAPGLEDQGDSSVYKPQHLYIGVRVKLLRILEYTKPQSPFHCAWQARLSF